MRISEFPAEVMCLIAEMAGTMSVLNFWVSGDSSMRHLLGHLGGVRVMEFVDVSNWSTSRWPMLLSELRGLEVLKFDRRFSPLYCASLVFHELKKLRQLRVLHLKCSDSSDILFKARKKAGNETLAEIFPFLEDLLISNLQYPLRLPDLPPSLVHLRVDGHALNTFNLQFPEHLQTLISLGNFIPTLLPQSLSTLVVPFLSASTWPQFPPSLTYFDAHIGSVIEIDNGFVFPRTLIHLRLIASNWFIHASFRHLTNLKSLVLRVPERQPHPIIAGPGIEFFPFPSSLEDLTLDWPAFSGKTVVLPPRLTHLVLNCLFSEHAGFRTVKLNSKEPEMVLSSAQWTQLVLPPLDTFTHEGFPPTLRHFSQKRSQQDASEHFLISTVSWPVQLPSATLTAFHAPQYSITDSDLDLMPICPQLDTVSLTLNCKILPSFITEAKYLRSAKFFLPQPPHPNLWESLPRDLIELELTLQEVASREIPLQPWFRPFFGLPNRQLQKLSVNKAQDYSINDQDLQDLAQLHMLKTLIFGFSFNNSITGDPIALLPRSLTATKLSSLKILSGSCLKSLPPNTIKFEIFRMTLKNGHLKHIPQSPKTLRISNTKDVEITPDCIPDLPPRFDVTTLFQGNIDSTLSDTIMDQIPDPRITAGSPVPLFKDPKKTSTERSACIVS